MERDPVTLRPFCTKCWVTIDIHRVTIPPEAFCSECGTTWIIDTKDRDWHVSTPYCQICDEVLPDPKTTPETGGASSSNAPIPCGFCGAGMLEGQEVAKCAECNCRHHGNMAEAQPCSNSCRYCIERWFCHPPCQRARLWHDCMRSPGSSELSDERPQGARTHDSNDGTDESSGSEADELACPAVVVQEVRWDDWEERVEEHRRTQQPSRAARAASTVDMCVTPTDQSQNQDWIMHTGFQMDGQARTPKLDKGIAKNVTKHMEKYLTPCMPTIFPEPQDKQKKHREKLASRELPFNLMVARPVGRQEMTDCPEAQAAMQK